MHWRWLNLKKELIELKELFNKETWNQNLISNVSNNISNNSSNLSLKENLLAKSKNVALQVVLTLCGIPWGRTTNAKLKSVEMQHIINATKA